MPDVRSELEKSLLDLQAVKRIAKEQAAIRGRESILNASSRFIDGPITLFDGNSVGNPGEHLKICVGQLPPGDLELAGFQVVQNYFSAMDRTQGFTIPYIAILSSDMKKFLYAASVSRRLFETADHQSGKQNIIDWQARLDQVFAFITARTKVEMSP